MKDGGKGDHLRSIGKQNIIILGRLKDMLVKNMQGG